MGRDRRDADAKRDLGVAVCDVFVVVTHLLVVGSILGQPWNSTGGSYEKGAATNFSFVEIDTFHELIWKLRLQI